MPCCPHGDQARPNHQFTEAIAMLTRRSVLAGLAVLASAAPNVTVAQEKVVRMAHLKIGGFGLLKARGKLEERLRPLGYTVNWTEFPAGPPPLEGVQAGGSAC